MENETERQFIQRCADCPTAADCKTAFGKYWRFKSADGAGCNCPFPGYRRRSQLPPSIYSTPRRNK